MKKILVLLFVFLFLALPLVAQQAAQILYSEGAKTSKWGSIGLIQANLRVPVSGTFGEETRSALLRFQSTLNLAATGHLDTQTWRILTNRTLPTVQERSEALTFDFEATDLDRWEWNYSYDRRDPSGATWGPMGLTVLDNEIQPVFREIDRSNPSLLRSVFGKQYAVAREFMQRSGADAKSYLRRKVYAPLSKRTEWIRDIQTLANDRRARSAYLKLGRTFLAQKMKALNDAYPVQTELDYAFYWDLAIHTSGLTSLRREKIDQELSLHPAKTPAERRAIMGKVFVETLGNPTQRKTRGERNAVYIDGVAAVHGTEIAAAAFGLADRPFSYSGSE